MEIQGDFMGDTFARPDVACEESGDVRAVQWTEEKNLREGIRY